jgi:hypothetical protein
MLLNMSGRDGFDPAPNANVFENEEGQLNNKEKNYRSARGGGSLPTHSWTQIEGRPSHRFRQTYEVVHKNWVSEG